MRNISYIYSIAEIYKCVKYLIKKLIYTCTVYINFQYTLYAKCVENDGCCSCSTIIFNLPPRITKKF